jgi:hypothetical protein
MGEFNEYPDDTAGLDVLNAPAPGKDWKANRGRPRQRYVGWLREGRGKWRTVSTGTQQKVTKHMLQLARPRREIVILRQGEKPSGACEGDEPVKAERKGLLPEAIAMAEALVRGAKPC